MKQKSDWLFGVAIVVEILFSFLIASTSLSMTSKKKKDWNGKRGDEIFSIKNKQSENFSNPQNQ